MTFSITTLNIKVLFVTLSIKTLWRYGECRVVLIVMLNVIMMSVILLSVIMPSVIMLYVVMQSVVEPWWKYFSMLLQIEMFHNSFNRLDLEVEKPYLNTNQF
jgi:nitrate/nitrite-specific signal transduction histidine kinase